LARIAPPPKQTEKNRNPTAMTAAAARGTMAASSPLQGSVMKTWTRRTLFALFGTTIALGAAAAGSRYCGHHGWNASAEERQQFRERMVDHVAKRLDLNADQKQKLASLADKLQQQRAAMAAGTPDPRAAVRGLVAGDKFDRAKAQALLNEKTAALNAGSPEVIAAAGDFFDSLGPAQQAQVREFMEHRRGWWRRG
jgi:Spy/CpxP family protein refolding chaperone